MAKRINWNTSLQVAGGPAFALSGLVDVDAYEELSVTVKRGETSGEAQPLPGAKGKVLLVLITSDYLDANLTCKLGDKPGAVPLDQPQLFTGAGAVQYLPDPLTIVIDNTKGAQDANVRVLVGRNS